MKNKVVKFGRRCRTRRETAQYKEKGLCWQFGLLALLMNVVYLTGDRTETLVVGLSPGQFTLENCDALRNRINKAEMIGTDGEKIIPPETIKFISQGVGIFFSHVLPQFPDDFKRRVCRGEKGEGGIVRKLYFYKKEGGGATIRAILARIVAGCS